MLVGILDKNHYGATAYSLIHCIYELYGGDVSTQLLSSLTKVFTIFLQTEGFTLGVHDILVLDEADKKRAQIVKESRLVGKAATCQALDIPEDTGDDEMVEKLEEAYAKDPKFRATPSQHPSFTVQHKKSKKKKKKKDRKKRHKHHKKDSPAAAN